MTNTDQVAGSEAPFFIVGSARSGTTLLRLIFNAHGEIAVPPESRFVTELWEGKDTVPATSTLARLAAHKRFREWDLPIEAVADEMGDEDPVAYAAVMTAAFRAYARAHRRSRWGDKTPRYVEELPLLARLFPGARFIHLVRDGRNVALSYADVPFGPKTVPGAAKLWAERVRRGIRDGRPLGERYVEVRYEALTEDPDAVVRSLCAFIGVAFDPGMLDYTERARDAMLPRAKQFNPHVLEQPRKGIRSWDHDMQPRAIEVFEAIAGDALSDLGYKRRYPKPSFAARLWGGLGRLGVPLVPLPRSSRPAGG